VRTAHPDATVQVWAEDKHRLGLLPVIRRVWAPRGQRPTAHVRRRYEWVYVYAFVRTTTGASWWCLLPTVSTEAMRLALTAFAAENRIGATHRAVLVLDGAGWHTSGTLEIPEGIDLVVLPPGSPEVQPVERVWSLVDEPVANCTFADLDELEAVLVARCRTLRADRRTIKAHIRYHWLPRERCPRNTS
jgi:transposase